MVAPLVRVKLNAPHRLVHPKPDYALAGDTFGGPFSWQVGELYRSSKSSSSPLGAIVVTRYRNCDA
jgi:hypothetical protein